VQERCNHIINKPTNVITFVTVMQRLTANSKSQEHTSQILTFFHEKK